MRRLFPFAALGLAACASSPTTQTPGPVTSAPLLSSSHEHRTLAGMTAVELAQHFGSPRLTIREGVATKLQYSGSNCVLDAYLYPPESGQGVPRVIHVDTRTHQGTEINPQQCFAAIEGR
ncbi:hypothetical protein [Sphingomonas xanthus]|uniref:Lipoprotein n=1 Tax=Sphingomonas xanthus TaxID=2594473 RepID=A0A516IR59_9SPHN|nr:hypothetical protein [Sphingomonas xanthus]QDP19372.1 hypothetical protein FMM02_04965 [Sphingomonas xanthus]